MKPPIETLKALCPEVEAKFIRDHLLRLDDEYFERFDVREVAAHVRGLARLSPEHPLEMTVSLSEDGGVDCTVMAFDYPFEFSLITGVLFSMGFSVQSGDIFTYGRVAEPPGPARRPRADRARGTEASRRRRIIDRLSGRIENPRFFHEWSAHLRARMQEIIGLLERGDAESVGRAKQRVNEWVTERLAESQVASPPVLYPVQVRIENDGGPFTRLHVVGQDTPAFLYSLSTALSLHGISIEHVRIRTIAGRVEDEVDFVDPAGRPIRDPLLLDRIKLSVLFTKQFTYFLDKAPDPFTALSRFEQMVQDTWDLPARGRWQEALADPSTMRDLARLLGASDFLWEDFIRLQYESLLPILRPHVEGRAFSTPPEVLGERLREKLAAATSYEDRRRCLNEFKDREIFLIDLDHILSPTANFGLLAERLTRLAEHVIRAAVDVVRERLIAVHGHPRTVGGLEATFAVLGLGKLGGAALGYASDIELLFVFSDNGRTDGAQPIGNDEFYAQLARETAQFIEAKREGVFHVDLRLRPHGHAGPLACSLENFCRYYGPGGSAHSYERLALVNLRAIAGDPALGARLERLRDEFIYEAPCPVNLDELRELREKQFAEKRRGTAYNAKFSPGALVDLEYTVQILQTQYGKDHSALRTPLVHRALRELAQAGVLRADESSRLLAAYDFLRRLINGLRMLRGSAQDLFLPPVASEEFAHLARRMGYERAGALSPAQQLFVDFETHTAAVRTFVERHLGRGSLPGPTTGNVADLLLSEQPSVALRTAVLTKAGFRDTEKAFTNLVRLAGAGQRREVFLKLAVLACDMLKREPDPDMALNNWERFVSAIGEAASHYEGLLAQPRRLELLLAIFSRSQFLANILIRRPDLLDWVTSPENLLAPLQRSELEDELRTLSAGAPDRASWLRALRGFRQRQMLRIGTRDMCLRADMREILRDLSALAEAILQVAVERAWKDLEAEGRLPLSATDLAPRFCILAFGKLGGEELNYSSDIDLMAVYDDRPPAADASCFEALFERVRADLATHTEHGHVFRVDVRLRPYGSAGVPVSPVSAAIAYYRENAALWEIQAALKLRPVAGRRAVGELLLAALEPVIRARRDREEIIRSVRHLRHVAATLSERRTRAATDVKTGTGGLREIEFLVQGLQLIHAADHPEILTGNTLHALNQLAEFGLLPKDVVAQLTADYLFLRRVEHYLQILEDRQIHTVPTNPEELAALARRMAGPDAQAETFTAELDACLRRVHEAYRHYLHAGEHPSHP